MQATQKNREEMRMGGFNFQQGHLGDLITGAGATTNVDLVFVIDATSSMSPIIEQVKNFALSFHEKIVEGLKTYNKSVNQLRVKVIVFRDYYCEKEMALKESDFFYLPEEAHRFRDYVSGIRAKGGGDIPESSLEALAVAMRSDWVKEGTSKRHGIVLFTDAPPHDLRQQKDGIPENYPTNMFQSLKEMEESWNSPQGTCLNNNQNNMEKRASRLLIFAPEISPWKEIQKDFEQCILSPITLDNGGAELNMDVILSSICKSIK